MSDLYFTRATFDLAGESSQRTRGATRSYLIHQVIADLFGQYDNRPYLFRDDAERNGTVSALLLSSMRPAAPSSKSGREGGVITSIETKFFHVDVPPGSILDFEIRVNATKDVPVEGRKRSRRTDVWEAVWSADKDTELTPAEVYGDYIRAKLGDAATVRSAAITARQLVHARRGLAHKQSITFVATNVIGALQVLDANALQQMIAAGIGRSKAFGCGLLCLSRPGSLLPRRYPEAARRLYT